MMQKFVEYRASLIPWATLKVDTGYGKQNLSSHPPLLLTALESLLVFLNDNAKKAENWK